MERNAKVLTKQDFVSTTPISKKKCFLFYLYFLPFGAVRDFKCST